jgi:hypothetical protein
VVATLVVCIFVDIGKNLLRKRRKQMFKKLSLIFIVLLVTLMMTVPAFAGPPPNSGLKVVRYQGIVYLHNVDYKNGISIIVGADIVEFCNTFSSGFDLVNIQEIDVPEDANRIVQIANGDDVTTSVWPFTDFDCVKFTTQEPVAAGTADFISTDNDLYVSDNPDNVNWNAFGFTAKGQLTASDGSIKRLNAASRCTWDGVNYLDSGTCAVVINLK